MGESRLTRTCEFPERGENWPKEDLAIVAANLRNLRAMHGYTLKYMGGLCGIAPATYRAWEEEKCGPRRELLVKVASGTGVPLRDLMRQGGIPSQEDVKKCILSRRRLLTATHKELTAALNSLNEAGLQLAVQFVTTLSTHPQYNTGIEKSAYGVVSSKQNTRPLMVFLRDNALPWSSDPAKPKHASDPIITDPAKICTTQSD